MSDATAIDPLLESLLYAIAPNSRQAVIKRWLDGVSALHFNRPCLFSPLKILNVHPLLPSLLPTAAIAASFPLENSLDLSLQLMVKAVLATAL